MEAYPSLIRVLQSFSTRENFRSIIRHPVVGMLNAAAVAHREQIPALVPVRQELRRRGISTIAFRKMIYNYGVYANPLIDATGISRETSAEYYR